MTGLSYTLEGDWGDVMLMNYHDQITLAILAFVCAQEDYERGFFNNQVNQLLEEMNGQILPNFDRTLFGVHLTCQSDLDFDTEYGKVAFEMEKVGE